MSTKDWSHVETNLQATAARVFDDYREALTRLGITIKGPEVVKDESSPYSSEIRAYFWRHGNVFDVLEFFAVFKGQPGPPEEEAVEWLRQEVEEILRRAEQRSPAPEKIGPNSAGC